MPEGSSIRATDRGLSTLAEYVRTLDGVTGTTQLSGTGGLRSWPIRSTLRWRSR